MRTALFYTVTYLLATTLITALPYDRSVYVRSDKATAGDGRTSSDASSDVSSDRTSAGGGRTPSDVSSNRASAGSGRTPSDVASNVGTEGTSASQRGEFVEKDLPEIPDRSSHSSAVNIYGAQLAGGDAPPGVQTVPKSDSNAQKGSTNFRKLKKGVTGNRNPVSKVDDTQEQGLPPFGPMSDRGVVPRPEKSTSEAMKNRKYTFPPGTELNLPPPAPDSRTRPAPARSNSGSGPPQPVDTDNERNSQPSYLGSVYGDDSSSEKRTG